MGAVSFSIDPRLIEIIGKTLSFDVFVETGTFRGDTIEIVQHYFNHIYSVELSEHYYEIAHRKFGEQSHISLFQGDSAKTITAIKNDIQDRSVVYWLDAHWCIADATAGQLSQCPLLAELASIEEINNESMIIIDDARLFLATPGAPHEISDWPTFHAITQALYKLSSNHQLSVVNDCILFFPKSLEASIQQFAYEYGVDWLDMLNRCRSSEAMLQEYLNMGVWQRVRGIIGYLKRCLTNQIQKKIRFNTAPIITKV